MIGYEKPPPPTSIICNPDDRSRLVNIVASRFSVLIHYLEVTVASLHCTVPGHGGLVATPPSVTQLLRRVPEGAPANLIHLDRTEARSGLAPAVLLESAGPVESGCALLTPSFCTLPASVVGSLMPCWFYVLVSDGVPVSLKDGKGNHVLPRGWTGLWNPSGRVSFSTCR